jgi:hypothetical protein
MWNPFRWWRERREQEALERARDREMFLSAIQIMADGQRGRDEVALEQARMMQKFFDAFITSEETVARVLRDEDEALAERERWGEYGES